eukprot:7470773-Pyramimonas_sp.AAC.1
MPLARGFDLLPALFRKHEEKEEELWRYGERADPECWLGRISHITHEGMTFPTSAGALSQADQAPPT